MPLKSTQVVGDDLPKRLPLDSSFSELYDHQIGIGPLRARMRQTGSSFDEGETPVASPLKVEFQFDFGSPNAYLAELVIPSIEQRTGVKFEYVPVLLGGIYKATGNLSPLESLRGIKNKPEYIALETQRFIDRHHITAFRQNPF